MKLDQNINADGKGKYALIKLREVDEGCEQVTEFGKHIEWRFPDNAIDFGSTPDTEFFVIRLKDKYAAPALRAYAFAVTVDDPEYADEIHALAQKAEDHPFKKRPD